MVNLLNYGPLHGYFFFKKKQTQGPLVNQLLCIITAPMRVYSCIHAGRANLIASIIEVKLLSVLCVCFCFIKTFFLIVKIIYSEVSLLVLTITVSLADIGSTRTVTININPNEFGPMKLTLVVKV